MEPKLIQHFYKNFIFKQVLPVGMDICYKCDYFTIGFKSVVKSAKERHECLDQKKSTNNIAETALSVKQIPQRRKHSKENTPSTFTETLLIPNTNNTSTIVPPKRMKNQFEVNDRVRFFNRTTNQIESAIVQEIIDPFVVKIVNENLNPFHINVKNLSKV